MLDSAKAKAGWDAAWDYVMEAHLGTGVAWSKERLEANQKFRDAAFEKWWASRALRSS
jgi:hypothetical protein